jgi:hypothetical protein
MLSINSLFLFLALVLAGCVSATAPQGTTPTYDAESILAPAGELVAGKDAGSGKSKSEPCYPPPKEAIDAYTAWGKTKGLVFANCGKQCRRVQHAFVRLCAFRDKAKKPVFAVCNGRSLGPPCKLPKKRRR